MVEHCWLAQRFDEHRPHLRALAYRMLGSSSDAEDVVQDAWLRLNRTGSSGIDNLGGWLTTVVARVCLNMLRSREARREEPLGSHEPEPDSSRSRGTDLEQEMVLADSVGLALLVVLDTLGPSERPAFVLHDMFDVPFKEFASIVDCSPSAARQLASRGRRRVQGRPAIPEKNLARRRAVVDAFLAASRGGDFHALLAVLDPDVVLRVDRAALPTGATREFQGAAAVAKQALAYSARSRFARPALVNGAVGVVVAPHGRLVLAACRTWA